MLIPAAVSYWAGLKQGDRHDQTREEFREIVRDEVRTAQKAAVDAPN